MYEVKISKAPGFRLLGLHHSGDDHQISSGFDRVGAFGASHSLVGPATDFIGICFDDPQSGPEAMLCSCAVFGVAEAIKAEGIPYDNPPLAPLPLACSRAPRPNSSVYQTLYHEWLPTSGRERAVPPASSVI